MLSLSATALRCRWGVVRAGADVEVPRRLGAAPLRGQAPQSQCLSHRDVSSARQPTRQAPQYGPEALREDPILRSRRIALVFIELLDVTPDSGPLPC